MAKKANYLREEAIPTAMQELGFVKLVMADGQTITITNVVYASIPADNVQEAFQWLQDNNLDGIIKSKVMVEFGRGELDEAAELVQNLQNEDFDPTFEEKVHPQTLKATLRELIASGTPVPLELFGARAVTIAKVSK